MAIRKDLDDMLNNLKNGKPFEPPENNENNKAEKHSVSKFDNMSVDDLLMSITSSETSEENPHENDESERLKAERQAEIERIKAEKERAEAERIKAEKERAEAERIKAEKERAEAEKIKAEKEHAEAEKIKAEKERAEAERIKAEKERAEAERIKAEKELAEAERIKAEKELAEAEWQNIEDETDEEKEAVAALSSVIADSAEKHDEDSDDDEKSSEDDHFSLFKKKDSDNENDEVTNETDENADSDEGEKKSKKITSTLKEILDENPDEILAKRSEQTESDDDKDKSSHKGRLKKGMYAFFGVIFSVLACIGLITVIAKGIDMVSGYTSGNSQKDRFEQFIYPAVIMDIESFNSPSELPSDQILTAAIWSMIMTEGVTDQYELTFDVVVIPEADVESYAVKLFGDDIPELKHTTVGPSESRFYYNEETKSYNVPVSPITYTYSPEIRKATKSGNEYTIEVDYIDELPSWLPKTSSKSVEFVIEDNNGELQIKSMKILSTSSNGV